jgi:hypothetical protein
MADSALPAGTKAVISKPELHTLITLLADRGYKVIGPVVRDGAIIYDEVASISDLPAALLEAFPPSANRAIVAGAPG